MDDPLEKFITSILQNKEWTRVKGFLENRIKNTEQATRFLLVALGSKAPKWIIEILINKGASVNATNECPVSPLLNAMSEPNINNGVLRLLIEKGADVNFCYKTGLNARTFLMLTSVPTNGILTLMLKNGLERQKDLETHPSKAEFFRFTEVYYCVFPLLMSKKVPVDFTRALFSFLF